MKNIITLGAIIIAVSLLSCTKSEITDKPVNPLTAGSTQRSFRFQLYTNKDFSNDSHLINFSIFIRSAAKTILDSSLASMQLKDIPNADHKLIIEKTIADNGNIDLAAGFRYELQGVGNSSYIDTSKAGAKFKIIDFAFQ